MDTYYRKSIIQIVNENIKYNSMKQYSVDQRGYYGEFGGAYIPEILHKCVAELEDAYLSIMERDRKSVV